MADKVMVVVPWHRGAQRDAFCEAWDIGPNDSRVVFQEDRNREGCGKTKNRGVAAAVELGAEIVIVLDDDCYPVDGQCLEGFKAAHVANLSEPAAVPMFQAVTRPASRGTPYHTRTVGMPVAASMGFWLGIGDYDAPGQLVHGTGTAMEFSTEAIFGRYFPLCGMNLAFRPGDWSPWCRFIEVPRFDDIWMGWLFQKEAYRRGCCFRLDGPVARHSRQSNVWANLRDEAVHLERNETLWQDLASSLERDYDALRRMLPV
jgi:hypothetical protein